MTGFPRNRGSSTSHRCEERVHVHVQNVGFSSWSSACDNNFILTVWPENRRLSSDQRAAALKLFNIRVAKRPSVHYITEALSEETGECRGNRCRVHQGEPGCHPERYGDLVRAIPGASDGYLVGRLRDRQEAEEVAQEVFVAVYIGLATLKKTSAFVPGSSASPTGRQGEPSRKGRERHCRFR